MLDINRELLIQISWDLLQFCLLSPQTNQALLVYLMVGFLFTGITLGRVHGIGNAARSSIFLGFFCALIGLFGLLQIAALIKIYALPLLKITTNSPTAWIALILVAFFLMIVPFTRACFQAGYFTSVLSWLCALLVGLLSVFGTRSVYNPVPQSEEEKIKNFETFARDLKEDIRQQVDERLEQLQKTNEP